MIEIFRLGQREYRRWLLLRRLRKEVRRLYAPLGVIERRVGFEGWLVAEDADLPRVRGLRTAQRGWKRAEAAIAGLEERIREVQQEMAKLRRKRQSTLESLDTDIESARLKDQQAAEELQFAQAQLQETDRRLAELDEDERALIMEVGRLSVEGDASAMERLEGRRRELRDEHANLKNRRVELARDITGFQRTRERRQEEKSTLTASRQRALSNLNHSSEKLERQQAQLTRWLKGAEERQFRVPLRFARSFAVIGQEVLYVDDSQLDNKERKRLQKLNAVPELTAAGRAIAGEIDQLESEITRIQAASKAELLWQKIVIGVIVAAVVGGAGWLIASFWRWPISI